jgi:hypothetical protein
LSAAKLSQEGGDLARAGVAQIDDLRIGRSRAATSMGRLPDAAYVVGEIDGDQAVRILVGCK